MAQTIIRNHGFNRADFARYTGVSLATQAGDSVVAVVYMDQANAAVTSITCKIGGAAGGVGGTLMTPIASEIFFDPPTNSLRFLRAFKAENVSGGTLLIEGDVVHADRKPMIVAAVVYDPAGVATVELPFTSQTTGNAVSRSLTTQANDLMLYLGELQSTATPTGTNGTTVVRSTVYGIGETWACVLSKPGVIGAQTLDATITGPASNAASGATLVVRQQFVADTTPPTLSSPTGTGGALLCSGSVSTDEANGALWAVATASATAPTGVQVEAGQDHTGAAALRVVSNQAVTATGVQTIASGAVTAGTRFLHFMHKDAAGNRSAVASSTSFTVTSGGTAPSISTQPTNQSVTAPAAATFTVVATGTGTLTYQWQRNPLGSGAFADISGATSASYTTPATTVTGGSANNTDTYRCVVTGDTAPAATSNAATLTVSAAGTAPSITVQPSSQTVTAPAVATFSVTATGSGTLTYQWQRNGSNISGATSSSYTTPATAVTGGSANNGDTYRCIVTGDTAPAATSSSATLTVNASGSFSAVTDIIAVAGVALTSTAVFWTWFPSGRAGTIGTVVNGTGTTNGIGALTVSHSVAGDGLLLVSTRPGPAVANDRLFAQFLTLA